MKIAAWFQGVLVVMAGVGMHLPQPACAQQPLRENSMPQASTRLTTTQAPKVLDIALNEHGELRGQVVDAQGVGFAGAEVSIWQGDREVGSCHADAQGNFALQVTRGGTYRVLAAGGCSLCRVWTKAAAPPAAQQAALVVASQNIVRGRMGPSRWQQATPWVLAGALGAAMIVPISLTNDNPSGS